MPKKKKKRRTQDTWKKKKWYTIISPKSFDEKVIGTTPAEADKKIKNRSIKVPLDRITGNISQQFIKINLKTSEIKGQTVHTQLSGFELSKDFVHRNIRRRRSMIRAIPTLITKDRKKIRITLYTFTRRKISTRQKNEIRQKMTELIGKKVKETSFENLIKKCVDGTVRKEIMKEVKKIAPIKGVDVSKCKLI